MNTKNIKRSIALMKTLPEDRIKMAAFRDTDESFTHVCKSNGCVIGFSTELDTEENLKKHILGDSFDYEKWSEEFFEIPSYNDEWEFMFDGRWPNDKEQIIKRMQWIANGNEVPDGFFLPYGRCNFGLKLS